MNFANLMTASNAGAAARAVGAVVEGDWQKAVATIGRGAVQSVTIRTQVSPPFTFDPFAESPPEAPPNPLLSLLKPEITIQTPAGTLVAAPYGTPSRNYLPWLVAAALVFGVGAVGVIATIARRAGR